MATGRRSALPPSGTRAQRVRASMEAPVVQHRDDTSGAATLYDFSGFPVGADMQVYLAKVFESYAGPLGTAKAKDTAATAYRNLRRFALFLAAMDEPPPTPGSLTRTHLNAYRLAFGATGGAQVGKIKFLLRHHTSGLTPEFVGALAKASGQARRPQGTKASYTDKELTRVLKAARADIRVARDRMRAATALLERWRSGLVDASAAPAEYARGEYLHYMAVHGDVPRTETRDGRPYVDTRRLRSAGFSTVEEAMGSIYLTLNAAGAFLVLLAGLTGENKSTIARAPAAHHRTDTGSDVKPGGTVLLNLRKPRRGPGKAAMTVPLREVPPWAAVGVDAFQAGKKELLSPLGTYLLAVELGRWGRSLTGSDRLLVWWAVRGGAGVGGGVRTEFTERAIENTFFAQRHDLRHDDGTPMPLDFGALRLTFVNRRYQPVAHTQSTFHKEYVTRDRSVLADYQRIVAKTQQERVAEARASLKISVLNEAEITAAAKDPGPLAARLGVPRPTVELLLQGRLDTVLGGCTDNLNGPFNPGSPCGASFLLCTACACAVALPQHVMAQVATLDALLERRNELPPLEWASRFGLPWARLSELLARQPAGVVDRARAAVDHETRAIVQRMLSRELDA